MNNFIPSQASNTNFSVKPGKIKLLQRNKRSDESPIESSPTERRSPSNNKLVPSKSSSIEFKKPAAIGSERGGNSSNTESPDLSKKFKIQNRVSSDIFSSVSNSPFDTSLQNTIHQNLHQALQNSPRNNLSEIFGRAQDTPLQNTIHQNLHQ